MTAEPIISNGGTVNTSGTPAADATPGNLNSYVAAAFTMNAGSNYTFSQAIAYGIQIAGPLGTGSTTYSMGSLWLGDGNGPATLVENLMLANSIANGTTYTLTFDDTSGATLIGGDTYWLVIDGAHKQSKWLTSTQTSSGPGATYDGAGYGTLSGTLSSPSVGTYSNGQGGVAGFEIDATPASVPEPSSLVLLGSGSGLVALVVGWRRRRARAV